MSQLIEESVLGTGLTAAAGWLALYIFYGAVSFAWPTSYSGIKSELDAHHRRGLARFLLVRLAPVTVVGAAVAHIAHAMGGRPFVAGTLVAVLHLASTDLRALIRARPMPLRRLYYHAATIVAVSLAGLVGAWLGLTFPQMFPTMDDFRAAIWTAAVAAVLGAAFLRVTSQGHGERHGPDLDWVRNDVGRALWEKIPQIAAEYDADPYLVQAVVAAEVMQRPRWLRRIERRWPRTRSFGVAQISSDRKLTDTESVKFLSQRLAGVQVPMEYGTVKRTPTLEWILEKHNSNQAFISDCLLFLNELKFAYGEGSEDAGADGLPALVLTRVHRSGGNFVLKGSLCSDATRLVLRSSDDGRSVFVEVPLRKTRQEWTAEVPIAWDSVTIGAESERADGGQPVLHVSLLQQFTQYSGPFG